MYNTTNANTGKKGTRCLICTGCGRCPGVPRGMQVVAEKLQLPKLQLDNAEGLRLMTVDIGTTTVAMQLYDRDGRVTDSFPSVNPQVEYGADVMFRIWAAESPWEAAEMQEKIRSLIGKGVQRFTKKLDPGERLQMVIAANTTMTYLLMGWDPSELGKAPFRVSHPEAVDTEIAGVPCHILPGLSAFVGGDITAGILASGMLEREEVTLLIDLGTNGEMALGNNRQLYACATAAGPAFEGGVNRGIWGADMVRLLATLLDEGLMDAQGLLREPYFTEGVRIGDVCVTQDSVRAVQLAKGAIAAGIEILRRRYGITLSEISRVVLAGGFGYYLDPKAAARIGLLPGELVDRTVTGGNTALSGAGIVGSRILAGADPADDLRLATKCEMHILNLAEQADFTETYLKNMDFC